MHGSLVVISGPSGVGKTSILAGVREKMPDIGFLVSTTTRSPRPGEIEGRDYFFVSREEFLGLLAKGAFTEWAENYGHFYGTLRSRISDLVYLYPVVAAIFDPCSFLRYKFDLLAPGMTTSIFVMPKSMEELRRRLEPRRLEEKDLTRRLKGAEEEIKLAGSFDHIVVNADGELDRAGRG